jgi:hypothetical protein
MKLVIQENEYEIPNDLTIDKWCDLMNWGFIDDNQDMIISIALDIPIKDCQIIPTETKRIATTIINTLMNPPIVKRNELKINLNEITFGDFVDMEVYISNGIHKNIKPVMKILFDFQYNDEVYITDIWDGLIKYFNFRNSIFNRYKKLFNIDDEPEVDEDKEKTPVEYIWWEIMMILADGKFLNIDQVVKKPLIQSLNYISWNKDKNTKELNRIKQQRNEL